MDNRRKGIIFSYAFLTLTFVLFSLDLIYLIWVPLIGCVICLYFSFRKREGPFTDGILWIDKGYEETYLTVQLTKPLEKIEQKDTIYLKVKDLDKYIQEIE